MKRSITVVSAASLVGAVLTMSLSARADGDPAAPELAKQGAQIVQKGTDQGAAACSACHGADGAGNAAAAYPRLAGLDAGYLVGQLKAYKDGQREHPIMKPIGAALTEEQMRAVGAYFAQLDTPSTPAKDANKVLIIRGEKVAKNGAWSHDVPACTQCHGPGGRGIGAAFPALAGQNAAYIEAQFTAWKSGKRHDGPNGLMKAVAEHLPANDVKAVAAYFASLPVGDAAKQPAAEPTHQDAKTQ